HDGDHPETSNTTPPVPPPTQQILHTISSIKLPILKKREYDIWAMKMEHYLSHIGYPIWQNVAFVSADNTSNTNDDSTAYSVSSPSVSKSQKEGSTSYM
nr:ribonuclease H-like domain-containing protein [Tanacetum cinerariifolium]